MKIRVFDNLAWSRQGDVGNNDCFYREAEVLQARVSRDHEVLLDVRFLHNGRVSRGHFAHLIRVSTEKG